MLAKQWWQIKFYLAFLSVLLPVCMFADVSCYDINKSIKISALDSISKQLILYDERGILSVFDTGKNELKTAKNFDNKITSLASKNNNIYLATPNQIQILNQNLAFLSSINISNIDKIYLLKNANYAIKDKNTIINLDTKNSTKLDFGKINELTNINKNICAASWGKVLCYDEKLKLTNILKDDKTSSKKPLIFTSLCQYDKEIFIADINGNVTNLHTNFSMNLASEIKAIKCTKNALFIATKDKIYKKEQENFKEVLRIQSGFLSMFASDEKLIVVTKGGEIYTI